MSAFVPGVSLSSSRTFVTGETTIRSTEPSQLPTSVFQISAIKLPSLPSLPGQKKSPPPKKPASTPAATTTPPKPSPNTIKLPDPKPKAPKTTSNLGAFPDGLPKFYNPSTARSEFIANAKGQGSTAFDIRKGVQVVPTNQRVNQQGGFRNMDPYTEPLVWARPGWSSDEARVGVRVALRNVLGNANLFESEVEELAYSISCVTDTADIKEFVRAIGLSNAYRKRFFEGTSNTRFVECNFLHFLGRAPRDQAEVSEHIQIINQQGYNAEINSYVDSDEYDTLFGNSRIPAPNFRGGHMDNNGMVKLAVLNGGFSTSDRISTKAYLGTGNASRFTTFTVQKGLPEAWRGENAARDQAGPISSYPADTFWNPSPSDLRDAETAWASKYGTWNKFWYKDSVVYKEVMKPKMSSTVEEQEEAAAVLKYGTNMAKAYLGCRWAYDIAPVIEITPPTGGDNTNGVLGVAMKEITFSIPSDLQQSV